MDIIEEIRKNLISGKHNQVELLTQSALDSGLAPTIIINDGFIRGMEVVGKRFRAQEIWIPEVLMAAKAMHMGMDVLGPIIEKEKGGNNIGKIVLGTVQGDVHDIGKNLVGVMLRGTGFAVVDIGVNAPPRKFVDAAIAEQPDIIGMSALLSTAIPKIADTVTTLKQAGIRKPFKTIVGGAAVSQEVADNSGADAYGAEAGIAVEKAKALMKQLAPH